MQIISALGDWCCLVRRSETLKRSVARTLTGAETCCMGTTAPCKYYGMADMLQVAVCLKQTGATRAVKWVACLAGAGG